VVENHGGSIAINSGPDGGTEVVMSIPQEMSRQAEETTQ
jgi:signal transduction histidine kinase